MQQSSPTAPRLARGEAFPRRRRISARRDFTATYAEGRRLPGRLVVVFARPLPGEGRLGVTATRKTGNAVARNRARRRVREIYRRWRARSPLAMGLDVVVNVTVRTARRRADRARGRALVAARSSRGGRVPGARVSVARGRRPGRSVSRRPRRGGRPRVLQEVRVTPDAPGLPVHADVLGVRARGGSPPRVRARPRARGAAAPALPPVPRGRTRSRTLRRSENSWRPSASSSPSPSRPPS